MPGKRRLAAELSVSVNTVDAAYQILAAEGHLEPKRAQRLYVQEYLALPPRPERARAPGKAHGAGSACRGGRTRPLRRSGMIFPPGAWTRRSSRSVPGRGSKRSCSTLAGAADPRRCSGRLGAAAGAGGLSGRIPGRAVLAPADRGGSRPGIPAGPAGPAAARQSRRGDPRYPRAKQVLENNGVECCCLPVDEDGLSIEELSRSGASVCYVTPSHQFPYRRHHAGRPPAELLHWAAKRPGSGILLRMTTIPSSVLTPAPAQPAGDGGGRRPGGLPFHLLPEPGPQHPYRLYGAAGAPAARLVEDLPPRYASTVGRFEQQTLARFITEGILPGIWPGSGWLTRPGGMP